MLRLSACAWIVLLGMAPLVPAAETYLFLHDQVLGTRCELKVQAGSAAEAAAAERAILAEIDRLSAVLSGYDPQSEYSRWQREHGGDTVSRNLVEVLRVADRWRIATGGAFHPGVELLSRQWQAWERGGQLPDGDQLRRLTEQLRVAPWTWTAADRVRWNGAVPVSLNALAKGYIIDRACAVGQAVPGVSGVLVNIGGDLKVAGTLSQRVTVAAPEGAAPEGNVSGASPAAALAVVPLVRGSLATSSGAFRGFTLAGRRWSHLLDPRTGWPVEQVVSATVLAPQAVDADALATACSVLAPSESLTLIDGLPETACLLATADGRIITSRSWSALGGESVTQLAYAEPPAAAPAPAWNGGFELTVELEINAADGGARYRRPYVAVWVEDKDGYPVRTIALWVQSTGPGPRWIPDLKRWYRGDLQRKVIEQTDLVETISEATRRPGQYRLTWDGRDSEGRIVKPGQYTVCIEAAREHGTYQLGRRKLTLADAPARQAFEPNTEIKAAVVDYHRRESVPAGR